jgi:hypothetical protein
MTYLRHAVLGGASDGARDGMYWLHNIQNPAAQDGYVTTVRGEKWKSQKCR